MTQSYSRVANLLGALALAVADRLREAAEGGAEAAKGGAGGLGGGEAAALVTLAHYPGQPIVSLGRTLGLTHSGAVRLADRMESAGLVRRTASGRGRAVALVLTDRGRRAAAGVLARRQAAAEDLARLLGPAEAEALARLAERLLAGMTTDRASALRLCRLCDEPVCGAGPGCPVDRAIGA